MPSTQPEPIESPALADPAASTKPSLKDDRKLPVSVKVEPGTVHTVKAGNGKGSGNPSVAAASPAPTALTDAVPEPGSQATAQKEMDAEDEEIRSREELDKIPPPPPQLSEGAIDRRLRRIVAPRSNGKHKVPQQVVDQFENKEERRSLQAAFEKVGYNADPSTVQAL